MNILYGVQGTGNGHISRARIMAKKLALYPNISVTYLFSGRARKDFFDMEIFGDFLHKDGFTFITKDGKIDQLQTAKKNNIFRFFYDIKTLSLDDYDLVLTDFEPITAWAAKLNKKACIGVGHQYAFGENTPLAGDNYFTRLLMRKFAPAAHSFGLHWHNYSENVLPPIIDVNIKADLNKPHILVYLPFENQQWITSILQQIPDVSFVQYSPELNDKKEKNVQCYKTNYHGFKKDLTQAHGVICNSGFELISECLHIGLPILTKPLNGQMEQHSNALALKQLNYADVIDDLSPKNIVNWIAEKKAPTAQPIPDVAAAITKAIINNQWHDVKTLNKQLW